MAFIYTHVCILCSVAINHSLRPGNGLEKSTNHRPVHNLVFHNSITISNTDPRIARLFTLCQAQIRSNVFIEIKSGTVKDSGRSFLMEIPCGTKAINCFRIELRNGRDFLPSSNHCRCHSGTCAFFAWMR